MSFTISPCREGDDWTRLFAIVADAFGDIHPYLDYVFPDHALPAGKEAGGKRLLEAFKTDPHAVFYKATVTGSDEIVGVAKWLVFDGVVPERKGLTGKWWPSAEAKELANYVAGLHTAERWKAITTSGGHVVSLDLMAVDPAYHAKGIGNMLLQWGLEKADDLNVETVVEAALTARGFYEKSGFGDTRYIRLVHPEKWQGKPEQEIYWMVRPAKQALKT